MMTTYTERFNDLTAETTQTAIDTAYFFQRQNAQLVQSWLNTIEASYQPTRDLFGKLAKQTSAAQGLWLELTQETFRTGIDTWTKLGQASLKDVSENLSSVSRQANNTGKKAEAAAK